MTTPKAPRTEPVRPRPSAERDQLTASGRTSRTIAVAALVLALAAIGLAGWQLLAPDDSCQRSAWAVNPQTTELLPDWTAVTQYDAVGKTTRFIGPLPDDGFSPQPEIRATVTCFERGAAESVRLSAQSAKDAAMSVVDRPDVGDQAYSAADVSGASVAQLRKGSIVVYLVGSADADITQLDGLLSAYDRALGGDGGTITPPTVPPSDDLGLGSLDPGESLPAESQAAPDLVARLPTQVGDIKLIPSSTTGSTFLAEDPGSRAVLAALRDAGLDADDLRLAEAYDELGESDLSLLIVTVDGMPVEETRELVLDVWFAATGTGVERTEVELAGRTWTRVDYGDGGLLSWALADDDAVIVITTADEELAAQAAAALP